MLGEIANSKPGEGKVQVEPGTQVRKCSNNNGERSKGHRSRLCKLGCVGLIFTPAHQPRLTSVFQGGKERAGVQVKSKEAREGELMWQNVKNR